MQFARQISLCIVTRIALQSRGGIAVGSAVQVTDKIATETRPKVTLAVASRTTLGTVPGTVLTVAPRVSTWTTLTEPNANSFGYLCRLSLYKFNK